MIKREMLKRCLNVECRAFCALDEDVRTAMLDNFQYAQCLQNGSLQWCGGFLRDALMSSNANVWRLSPDTPTEPEVDYVEYDITINEDGWYCFSIPQGRPFAGSYWNFTFVLGRDDGLGIVYRDSNGVETLRTSVDAAFGTPVRVRFAKGE